jgi:peptidoglycan/LPS O-acetylase OafA/YrhL
MNEGTAPDPAHGRVYLPNLDSLRFFAALLVFLHHVELRVARLWPGRDLFGGPIHGFGARGVTFFFVLSGFLITYLLMEERERTGRVDALRFYARRALRIWPLYYFLVALAFLALRDSSWLPLAEWPEGLRQNAGKAALLYVGLLPNVAFVTLPYVPFVTHLWSIGAEEQFYAAWPLVLRLRRDPLLPLLAVVALWTVARTCLGLFGGGTPTARTLDLFLFTTRVDCMALGGLAAWAVRRAPGLLRPFQPRPAQAALWIVLAWMFAVEFTTARFTEEIYGVLFAVVVAGMACGPRPLFSLEIRPLPALGRISYGIYMYHPLAIGIVLAALPLDGLFRDSPAAARTCLWGASLALTVAMAAASYALLERPFLRWKARFSPVPSGA